MLLDSVEFSLPLNNKVNEKQIEFANEAKKGNRERERLYRFLRISSCNQISLIIIVVIDYHYVN